MKKIFSIVLSLLFIFSFVPATFAQFTEKELNELYPQSKENIKALEETVKQNQAKSANTIVSLTCPAPSYVYAPNASDSVVINILNNINNAVLGMEKLDKPQGCLNPRYDTKNNNCDNIPNSSIAYDSSGKILGCWVAPSGITRVGDIQTIKDLNEVLRSPFSNMKYVPKIEIPCDTNIAGGTCPKADTPANYIARLYQFGLMIAGLIALGVILFGAVEYTLSAGGVAKKEEAKDRILQAIYGILLLLGAYLILYTIDPKLVSLTDPEFQAVDLSTLLPPEIFIPENAGNNTVSESSGTGGITGCALANSNWGQGLLEIGMKGGEILGTGTGQKNCLKCMDGNSGPDANGACNCLEGLVRQPTGSCSAPTFSGVCKTGLIDTSGNCCPTGTSLFYSDNNKISQCLPACPIGSTYGATLQKCDKCLTGYGDVDGKCVKGTPSVMCQPSGYILPNGKCIP